VLLTSCAAFVVDDCYLDIIHVDEIMRAFCGEVVLESIKGGEMWMSADGTGGATIVLCTLPRPSLTFTCVAVDIDDLSDRELGHPVGAGAGGGCETFPVVEHGTLGALAPVQTHVIAAGADSTVATLGTGCTTLLELHTGRAVHGTAFIVSPTDVLDAICSSPYQAGPGVLMEGGTAQVFSWTVILADVPLTSLGIGIWVQV